jgi:DNA helicase-2/ATP-dependent DNA helicase PcrA
LRYYVTQQPRAGDRHVYGARSRFLEESVLSLLELTGWPEESDPVVAPTGAPAVRVDVAARLRELWNAPRQPD